MATEINQIQPTNSTARAVEGWLRFQSKVSAVLSEPGEAQGIINLESTHGMGPVWDAAALAINQQAEAATRTIEQQAEAATRTIRQQVQSWFEDSKVENNQERR